jgi:hypothetical protein
MTNKPKVVLEHVAEDGPTAFAHVCRLGAERIVSKRVDGTYRSGEHHGTAERDLESTNLRQCAPTMTRRKGEITRDDLKCRWSHHVALPAERCGTP